MRVFPGASLGPYIVGVDHEFLGLEVTMDKLYLATVPITSANYGSLASAGCLRCCVSSSLVPGLRAQQAMCFAVVLQDSSLSGEWVVGTANVQET